jgi:hypothetical protein
MKLTAKVVLLHGEKKHLTENIEHIFFIKFNVCYQKVSHILNLINKTIYQKFNFLRMPYFFFLDKILIYLPCIFFLPAYSDTEHQENRVDCSFDRPPPEGKVCKQPLDNMAPCTKANRYNFHKAEPCIFLKLNKVSVTCHFYVKLILFLNHRMRKH